MRNLIPHFIADKFISNETSGGFKAITMFMDISGFTPMTERLMQEGKEGAEVLSLIVNKVFEPVIETVYLSGGFISSFAGDAFTAIFNDTDKPMEIIACALEINRIIKKVGKQQTKFGEFELFVKLGLSCGMVEWGIVGNEKHKTYYFKAEAIDGCANSEHQCKKMDIIIDDKLLNILPVKKIEMEKISNKFYKLLNSKIPYQYLPGSFAIDNQKKKLSKEVLQFFLPKQILESTQQGEFREIASVFISFKEFEDSDKFNKIASELITQCDNWGGYFENINFGDKGANCLVVFGVPKFYENNLERALDFALKIKEKNDKNVRIGISSGIVFSGFKGSEIRTSYGVLGSIVNLSARIMMKAEFGEILSTESVSKNKYFIFKHQNDYDYKGFKNKIAIYNLITKKDTSDTAFFAGEMIGRQAELNQLIFNALSDNKFTGVSIVYGEAGMGKSRLLYEFVKHAKSAVVLFMQTDSVLKMSLNPFKYLMNNYFNKSKAVSKEDKKDNFESAFNQLLEDLNNSSDVRKLPIIKELERSKSILAAQVDVLYTKSLYEQLDAKARFENTLFAYKEFFKGLSLLKPIIIQIEDIHWLDEDSHEVFKVLCRSIADFPIMIVATSRFNDDGSKPILKIDKEIVQQEIVLDKLDQESAKVFIDLQLGDQADTALLKIINAKAENNPFYIEQIIHYLKENNLLEKHEGKITLTKQNIKIPSTINAIIVARVDRLEINHKYIVQLASVLGREVELKVFYYMLELYKSILDKKELSLILEKIEDEQLWNKFTEVKYIFKHALLHEAVYEMQLKARLRDLHNIAAQAIEHIHNDDEEKYYEIAYHYDKAGNVKQVISYYKQAGDWFQKNYYNIEAIKCYDKVLKYLDETKDAELFIDVLNYKGDVLELTGKWTEAEAVYQKAYDLADRIKDNNKIMTTCNKLAKIKSKKGNKEIAITLLEQSLSLALMLNDNFGIAQSYSGLGLVYCDLANYSKAMEYYEKQLLIATILGTKQIEHQAYIGLGNIYKNQGDYIKSVDCYKKAKEISYELGDKQTLSIANSNQGLIFLDQAEYDKALECFQSGFQVAEELGDVQSMARNVCNIGIVCHYKNDLNKAMAYYLKGLQIAKELGDKRIESFATGFISTVYHTQGYYTKAIEFCRKKLQIGKELNDRNDMSTALSNIGAAYFEQGDNSNALKYYNEALQIDEDLGDKRSTSISFGNIGAVYSAQGFDEEAIAYYDKGIDICRELKLRFYLSGFAYSKAEIFYKLKKYDECIVLNNEAKQIATEIQNYPIIFNSTILEHKLLGLENPDEAVLQLSKKLESEIKEPNIATIHYEIYQINQSVDHRQKALEIYQNLYAKTPNIEYKNRIDELTSVSRT